MLAESEFIELLQQVDNDILGVVMILSTIGIFLTLFVSIVAVFRTFNNILLTRMNHRMVTSLLAKGYSIDEVERLTYGNQKLAYKLRNAVRYGTSQFGRLKHRIFEQSNHPQPPVKRTA